ncbi:hypothetical protein BsWGS_15496 [Bradybaena similaris]
MAFKSPLVVCLCIEDLDCTFCDIVISQVASGHFFGADQPFHLVLQSSDDVYKLEELCQEVQDCAFPTITGVSWQTTLNDMARRPDIILVLLSNHSVPYTTRRPTGQQLQRLLSLVHYMNMLSNSLSAVRMDAVKVIITGDLALTAASVMSHRLDTLTARQLLAIDVHQIQGNQDNLAAANSGYSKTTRICEAVKQWWSGIKTSALTYLGVKYINHASSATMNQATGYFFSAPVNLVGPMDILSDTDTPINQDHIVQVKATTDAAFSILQAIDGQCRDHVSGLCLSYL